MEIQEKDRKKVHHGRNIRRIRQLTGVKQETLATDMELSQTQISAYEQKPVINDNMLERFAKALKVPPALLRELEENPVKIIIENNTIGECSTGGFTITGDNIINNPDPVDRIMELVNEKTALYERMLELEKEKNALLEKLLKGRK